MKPLNDKIVVEIRDGVWMAFMDTVNNVVSAKGNNPAEAVGNLIIENGDLLYIGVEIKEPT